MRPAKQLFINDSLIAEVREFNLAQVEGFEQWRIELALSARGAEALAAQRAKVEAALAAPITSVAIIQGEQTLRQTNGELVPILAESLRWHVSDDDRLDGATRGELVLRQAMPTSPELAQWSRTLEQVDGKARMILEGSAAGPFAAAWIESLRTSYGTPLEERVTEASPSGELHFRFVFADQTGSCDLAKSESISIRETRRVVEHVPLSPSSRTIRQVLGAPRIEATQRGSARAIGKTPAPEAPRWPMQSVERETRSSVEQGENVSEWSYRFLLDFNPLAEV